MKKKNIKKSRKTKSKFIFWILLAFFVGGVSGYFTHILVVNWHGFFVTCEDGQKPDKYGCCFGETYTYIGKDLTACCPEGADICFPPIK